MLNCPTEEVRQKNGSGLIAPILFTGVQYQKVPDH